MADQRVEVVDYDPGWPDRFAAQQPPVAELLGPWLTGIDPPPRELLPE